MIISFYLIIAEAHRNFLLILIFPYRRREFLKEINAVCTVLSQIIAQTMN